MTTTAPTATWAPGDVIRDTYYNPAIVLRVDDRGRPYSIMQLAGSDQGNVTYPPRDPERVTGEAADRARDWGRRIWRERGMRRSRYGL